MQGNAPERQERGTSLDEIAANLGITTSRLENLLWLAQQDPLVEKLYRERYPHVERGEDQ